MAETISPICPGIGSRLDDQTECSVPEAEHSIPEVGRVACLLPIDTEQSSVAGNFLSYERNYVERFGEAPEEDQHWRDQADGAYCV